MKKPAYYTVFQAILKNGKQVELWRASDGDNDIYTEYLTDNIVDKSDIIRVI